MKKIIAMLCLAAFMSSAIAAPLASALNQGNTLVAKLDKDKDKDKKKKSEKSCCSKDATKSGAAATGSGNGGSSEKKCCSKDAAKTCDKDKKKTEAAH